MGVGVKTGSFRIGRKFQLEFSVGEGSSERNKMTGTMGIVYSRVGGVLRVP